MIDERVAYPSLRVDVEQITREGARSFPPGRLGPLRIETGHLNVDRYFSSFRTAETADLPKLAPQFAIGAFQQRGGPHHFAHHPLEPIVTDRLFKLTLKGGDGLRLSESPLLSKRSESSLRLRCACRFIDRRCLLQQGLFPCAIQADTLVPDIAQLVEDTALLHQAGTIDVVQGLLQAWTRIPDNGLEARFQPHSAFP